MIQAAPVARYERWKATAEDGWSLIWPAPDDLLRQTMENHRLLSGASSALLQGVPLPEVRRSFRQWLGHTDDDRPIIATGHQTELHHPGVWVKNALINVAAERLGGRAIHFAVDTDAPKHLRLRWPGGSVALTDTDQVSVAWSGLLAPPSPAHLHDVEAEFARAAAGWDFKPLAPRFLDSMRCSAMESETLPAALTNAVHELDWSLGLRHEAMLVSPLCWSEPYLLFVYHVLARIDEFSADYNAALNEYRQENKIRTPGRPMPNLTCTADGCEAPFWLDDVTTGARSRAAVASENGSFVLRLPSGEAFAFDRNADGWRGAGELMLFLRRNGVRLSPRALTLTSVLRLLAADQFVHGIGGGQYDQVLDKLIVRCFGMEAPRFSVTTATLYFPSAAGRQRVCVPCLAQDAHRQRHSVLGPGKTSLIEAIAAAPRNSLERSVLFTDLHEKLAVARRGEPFKKWEQQYANSLRDEQDEKVVFDRELFYAIQPGQRLEGMIEKYRRAFGAAG